MDSEIEGYGKPRRLFIVIVPLIASLLTVAAIELGLAAVFPIPFSVETNMYFEADPYTGFRLKPHGVGYYQMGIPAIANSHGHRDVEISPKKPPGVFRILVLGDSFTVGANVRQEDAYPKILEQQLRKTYGPRIQVVNSGVGGWQPFQYAQYFEHYGYRFDADLILVGFFVGNDTFDFYTSVAQLPSAVLGHIVSPQAAAQPFINLKVFLYNHSNLARLSLNPAPAPSTFLRTQGRCDDFTDWYLAVQKARMPNHLRDSNAQRSKAQNAVGQVRRIKTLAGDTPVVVALLPDENQINHALQMRILKQAELAAYDFNMPQSMLRDMFREIGIPTIDILAAIRADPRCLYMNDTHWLPEGHRLAASAIFEQLSPRLSQIGIFK